jgi:hypothetical protein
MAKMASNEFHQFLTNLSKDASARNKYWADPVGTMKAANLSDSQIIAVLSQDPGKVQYELGGDPDLAARVRVIVTITISVE